MKRVEINYMLWKNQFIPKGYRLSHTLYYEGIEVYYKCPLNLMVRFYRIAWLFLFKLYVKNAIRLGWAKKPLPGAMHIRPWVFRITEVN